MNLLPRLRQSCQRNHLGTVDAISAGAEMGQGPSAPANALSGHPPSSWAAGALQGQDRQLLHNRVYLSGILAAEPLTDQGRDGEPVVVLLLAFPAPDANSSLERVETASCEIEVPADVVDRHGGKLQAGWSVFIAGQLTGGGGVIANELHSGPPPA